MKDDDDPTGRRTHMTVVTNICSNNHPGYNFAVFHGSRSSRAAIFLTAVVMFAPACSPGDAEPTNAELLAELEGRELTPAEVAQKEQVAELLCRLDDEVLVRIWDQLEPSQLAFQDFVFSRQCGVRNQLYAEATGRFKFEETTSTTR